MPDLRICDLDIADLPGSESSSAGAPTLVARHLRANVQAALADTRVVVVLGARQVGKSTLVAQIAEGEPVEWWQGLGSDALGPAP